MFLRSIKPKEYNEMQYVESMRGETLSDLAIPGIVLKSFYEIIIIFIAIITPIIIIILIYNVFFIIRDVRRFTALC